MAELALSRPAVSAPEPLIPARCAAEWLALADALVGLVPPCESSPESWWDPAMHEAAAVACGPCAAREACLAYAVAAREKWGVWGGLAPGERSVLRSGVAS